MLRDTASRASQRPKKHGECAPETRAPFRFDAPRLPPFQPSPPFPTPQASSSYNLTTSLAAKNATITNAIARKQATYAGLSSAVKNATVSIPKKLNKTASVSLLAKPNVTAAMAAKPNVTAKLAAAALILNHTMQAPKSYNLTKFNKTMLNLTLPKKVR